MDAPKDDQTVRAGLAIREAREAKGLTQVELRDLLRQALRQRAPAGAEQTVGQSAVSRWEQGVNAPEHWKWALIEEALDMAPGTLATIMLGRTPAPQIEERMDAMKSAIGAIEASLAAQASAIAEQTAALADQGKTMAKLLAAVRAADRRLRDQGI